MEIKLRAFYKGKMYYDVGLDPTHVIIYEDMGNKAVKGQKLMEVGRDLDIDVMLYIGVDDDNDKEIYVGDILGLNDPEDKSKCVIVFEHGSFKKKFFPKNEKPFTTYWNKRVDDTWVVIGNIHENPELTAES